MKITKDDLKNFINEEIVNELKDLQEKQWYDNSTSKKSKSESGGETESEKKKSVPKPKKKKSVPKPKKKTMEEGDDVFQSPTDEDCEDWSELIAIAKALKMSGSSIRALEEKSSESGCKEVIDETGGPAGITVEVKSDEY